MGLVALRQVDKHLKEDNLDAWGFSAVFNWPQCLYVSINRLRNHYGYNSTCHNVKNLFPIKPKLYHRGIVQSLLPLVPRGLYIVTLLHYCDLGSVTYWLIMVDNGQ